MYLVSWPDFQYGLLISIVGYSVTLLTLALLYYAFRVLPKLLHSHLRARLRKMGQHILPHEELTIPGDEVAAIALALHLHFGKLHDNEPTKLTIRRIPKLYSPWSSKLFGMRNVVRR